MYVWISFSVTVSAIHAIRYFLYIKVAGALSRVSTALLTFDRSDFVYNLHFSFSAYMSLSNRVVLWSIKDTKLWGIINVTGAFSEFHQSCSLSPSRCNSISLVWFTSNEMNSAIIWLFSCEPIILLQICLKELIN